MSTNITAPFPLFVGLDGLPLEDGYVYIGLENQNPETAPASVYWDSALTIPALQPLRTINGYISRSGAATNVFVGGNFSITVRDRRSRLVGSAASVQDLQALITANSGSSIVGFIASGAGAVSRNVQSKLREFVSLLDFGAVGDGTTDDTEEVSAAIATGKDILVPQGYTFAITGNVTGFADGQRIYGGGCFKKLGSLVRPMFLLPDRSDGVLFDNIEFDGTSSLFSAGNAVPAILGYITLSLKVTNCYFHDVIDVGIKLRDGANLYAAGNRFFNIGENGIELHNYTVDVRTGNAYTSARPVVEGQHTIIGNRFEKVTRYENPAGPLVDACGVNFIGAAGYPQKNVRIIGNIFIDCLRGVWTENNAAGSIADGVIISGNSFAGGVNGGTAENIYGKAGVGLIAVKHAIVSNNTFLNVANTNPVGTETACVIVSGSAGVAVGEDIEICNNTFVDDRGLTDRTEWGVYCLIGSNIRIHHNTVAGTASGTIYLHPTNVTNAAVYSNNGAESEYSWNQIVPLVFARQDIPANGNQTAYPYGLTYDDEIVIPSAGRIVAVSAKLSAAISAGTLTVRAYSDGTEQTNVQIVTADFGGGTVATKKIQSLSGNQVSAGERYKVVLTTSSVFAPTTLDAVITIFVDCGIKA